MTKLMAAVMALDIRDRPTLERVRRMNQCHEGPFDQRQLKETLVRRIRELETRILQGKGRPGDLEMVCEARRTTGG